jgi:hypothetical protein
MLVPVQVPGRDVPMQAGGAAGLAAAGLAAAGLAADGPAAVVEVELVGR